MTNKKIPKPKELKDFENAFKEYQSIIRKFEKREEAIAHRVSTFQARDSKYYAKRDRETRELLKNAKTLSGDLFKSGQVIAAWMDGIINEDLVSRFRRLITRIDLASDGEFTFSFSRRTQLDELNRVYLTVRPYLIDDYYSSLGEKLGLRLLDNVNITSKEYLEESVRCYNSKAYKASVIMAAAALEGSLRKIYDEKIGKSANKDFFTIINELEKTGAIESQKKEIINLCRIFRNFSAHPSDVVVSPDLAKIIIKASEAFVNSDAKKLK